MWLNDDNYIHNSSKNPDPCYERFRTLVQTGKIPKYVVPVKPKNPFALTGEWKKSSVLYAKYIDAYDHCHSDLTATTEDNATYKIKKVTVSTEDKGIEELLLTALIDDAKGKGITLQMELNLKADSERIKNMRKLLRKLKFVEAISDDEVELLELKVS